MSQKQTTAAGSLDPAFGDGGVVKVPFLDMDGAGPSAVLSLADKKLLVAMSSIDDVPAKVARLNEDGTLDNTFGSRGIVDLPQVNESGRFEPNHLCQLDDGGWLVSGGIGSLPHMAVIRLRSNGTLNTDFNQTGVLILDTAQFSNSVSMEFGADLQDPEEATHHFFANVVVQAAVTPGGKIILVINRGTLALPTGVVLRLDPNGSLDKTFNQKGFLNVEIPGAPVQSNRPRGVLIQPDGKVLVCGDYNMSSGGHHGAFVVRYDRDGKLDTQYGDAGVASFAGSTGRFSLYSMTPVDNGGIFVAGFYVGSRFSGRLIALNASGRLSPDFNKGQPLISDFLELSWLWLGFQADGKIIVTGLRYGASGEDPYSMLTARYLPDGLLDKSFGVEGWSIFNGNMPSGSALMTNNRIVICGNDGQQHYRGAVVRYLG
jgi:uncharacterized delta-60 repeat protein